MRGRVARRRISVVASSAAAADQARWLQEWKPEVNVLFTISSPGRATNERAMILWDSYSTPAHIETMVNGLMNRASRRPDLWITVAADLQAPALALNAPHVFLFRLKIDSTLDKYVIQWRRPSSLAVSVAESKEGEDASALWLTVPSARHLGPLVLQQLKAIATDMLIDVWRRRQRASEALLTSTSLPSDVVSTVLAPYISYKTQSL